MTTEHTEANAPSDLVSTGIEGLDQLLRGGLTPDRLYLVEGRPGTGKTTLALQFLLEGRQRGEPVLYVTLSETLVELQGVAASHGWSLDGVEVFQLAAAEQPAKRRPVHAVSPGRSRARRHREGGA